MGPSRARSRWLVAGASVAVALAAAVTSLALGPSGTHRSTAPAVTVRIISPAAGARVTGRVRIRVAAHARAGVRRVIFRIDARVRSIDLRAPYVAFGDRGTWRTGGERPGRHRITVIVVDRRGRTASASRVVVVVRRTHKPPTTTTTPTRPRIQSAPLPPSPTPSAPGVAQAADAAQVLAAWQNLSIGTIQLTGDNYGDITLPIVPGRTGYVRVVGMQPARGTHLGVVSMANDPASRSGAGWLDLENVDVIGVEFNSWTHDNIVQDFHTRYFWTGATRRLTLSNFDDGPADGDQWDNIVSGRTPDTEADGSYARPQDITIQNFRIHDHTRNCCTSDHVDPLWFSGVDHGVIRNGIFDHNAIYGEALYSWPNADLPSTLGDTDLVIDHVWHGSTDYGASDPNTGFHSAHLGSGDGVTVANSCFGQLVNIPLTGTITNLHLVSDRFYGSDVYPVKGPIVESTGTVINDRSCFPNGPLVPPANWLAGG